MKKLIVCLLVILPLVQIHAQKKYLPTPDDLNRFQTTKTYVVLSDNPMSDYNLGIRGAVEEVWDLSEYEFLDYKEFEEKSKDENASFLYLAMVDLEKDKTNARYKYLCLSLGKSDRAHLDDLKDITYLPLGYSKAEEERYADYLDIILQFMQNHVRKLIETPSFVSQNVYQHYNANMSLMKDKVLYLEQEDLASDISTQKAISQAYPYPFKIVEREELREVIASNDGSAVFLHKVGPENSNSSSRVFKMLIGVADAKLYYYNYHKVSSKTPDALLKNDLRRIAKAPQK